MYKLFVKRLIDLTFSVIAIILLLPLFLIVNVLLIFDFGFDVFFIQPRPGLNAKVFNIIKFRTMNNKKDKNGKLLPDFQRLSKTGKIIRSLSLDELPQLLNVIKGDMSLVGPRPLLVSYLEKYSTEQARRHEVRPGITGWAQVNGRNTISWDDKFKLDIWYVDNMSFTLDCKIIFLTILKVIKKEAINAGSNETMKPFYK